MLKSVRLAILTFIALSAVARPIAAHATPHTCADVLTPRHDYLQRLWEVTEHEGSEPIFEVDSYPERTPRHRAYRHSAQWWWTSPSLKHHQFAEDRSRAEWTMSNINTTQFYVKVYGRFQDIISDGTIDVLRKVDHSIEVDRTTYGEIRTAKSVIGTWRWFRARLADYVFPNDTIAELPYVRVNRDRGFTKELLVTKKLIEIMRKGFSVVEIGKLSLDGSPELRKRAMTTIELGWLRRASEEDVFIAHVTGLAHVRLYRKYGFQIAECFEVNRNKEAILWVRGYEFRRALEDLHHIQRRDSIEPISRPLQPLLPTEPGPRQSVSRFGLA